MNREPPPTPDLILDALHLPRPLSLRLELYRNRKIGASPLSWASHWNWHPKSTVGIPKRHRGRTYCSIPRSLGGERQALKAELNVYLQSGWIILPKGLTAIVNGSCHVIILYRPTLEGECSAQRANDAHSDVGDAARPAFGGYAIHQPCRPQTRDERCCRFG